MSCGEAAAYPPPKKKQKNNSVAYIKLQKFILTNI